MKGDEDRILDLVEGESDGRMSYYDYDAINDLNSVLDLMLLINK